MHLHPDARVLQTANGKRLARKRKPQRLDSFSFFIQDRLGADLGRFTEEAAKLGTHMAAAREAQVSQRHAAAAWAC